MHSRREFFFAADTAPAAEAAAGISAGLGLVCEGTRQVADRDDESLLDDVCIQGAGEHHSARTASKIQPPMRRAAATLLPTPHFLSRPWASTVLK